MTGYAKKLVESRYARVGVIVVVALGVYSNLLSNGFTFDDGALALRNPWIRDVRHLPDIFTQSIWSFYTSVPQNYYRPLMHVIYMFDYHVFGLEPWGFHLTKMLLHAGASVMVFLTAGAVIRQNGRQNGRQGEGGYKYAPLVAALLFATHPINTDSVANGITELSYAFFTLLAMYYYMKDTAPRLKASALFFFLALLSKETAVVLPLLLLAFDLTFKRECGTKALARRYLPYAAAAGVYMVMRYYALGGLAPVKAHAQLSAYGYFINVWPLFGAYLAKLVLPTGLNAAHEFHPVATVFNLKFAAGLGAAALFAGALYAFNKRSTGRGPAFFSLVWVVVPLVPALYIPALGDHVFSERYLYLSSAGFAILASLALVRLGRVTGGGGGGGRGGRVVLSTFLVIMLFYSVGTRNRNPVWHDELTLWLDTVQKSPGGHVPRNNLGNAYVERGRVEEGIEEYRAAIRLRPAYPGALYNLGRAYYTLGRVDEAVEKYKVAVRLAPFYIDARYNLALAYEKKGEIEIAVGEYTETLRVDPSFVRARNNLANIYFSAGRVEEALAQYRLAVRTDPAYSEARYNLGRALYELGRTDEAVVEYERAAALRPDEALFRYNLGLAYFDLGRTDEAVGEYKEAVRLKPDYAAAHNNLGTAYIRKGMTKEAVGEFREALEYGPGLAATRFNLGLALKILGSVGEARKEFEEALKIRPGFEAARKELDSIGRE